MGVLTSISALASIALASLARAQAPAAPVPEDSAAAARFNSTGRVLELPLPVRQLDRLIGEARMRIDPQDRVEIHLGDLVDLLKPTLSQEALAEVRSIGGADEFLGPERLGAIGIGFTFDTAVIEASIALPTSLLAVRTITFQDLEIPADTPAESPSFFSALIDYRAALDYVQTDAQTDEVGLRAPNVSIDLDGRFGPVAYENELLYSDEQEDSFGRSGSRLIYDQEAAQRRWTAGDLFAESTGFQALSDIAGLSVARSPDLIDPSKAARRQGQRTFILDRTATVDVRVNGQTIRRLRLPPGTYDFRDFPFTSGANEVEFEITDDTGRVETLRFDFFSDRELLDPGDQEYVASIGVESNIEGGSRQYEEDPLFSGFLRRGVTPNLTLGANLQAKADITQVGAEATFSALDGLVSIDLAGSDLEPFGPDYAARLDYRWFPASGDDRRRSFNMTVESLGRRFGGLSARLPDNAYDFTIAARYSQDLSADWSGGLSAQFNNPRPGRDRATNVTASASRRLGGFSVFLSVLYDARGDTEEITGAVSISRRFGRNHDVRASYDGRDDRWQAGYGFIQDRGGIGSWTAGADVLRVDERSNISARAQYAAPRADLSIDHQVLYEEVTGDLAQSRTSFRAAGAIGYAKGRVALGRPANDAFAILTGHESLEGRPLRVGGDERGGYSAVSGPLGPALVPLGSYANQVVQYSVEGLPAGYDLGAAAFVFRPRLHDGYTATVGSPYNVTVIGELLDPAGEPVALQTAEVRSLDDPDKAPVEIFTNRVGRFGASGLAPGRWRIRTLTGEPLEYALDVPETADLMVRIGRLSPN